jgi:myo-inositol-1(or 4)-monophosphatase
VDSASEHLIAETLRGAFPDYSILAEEGAMGGGDLANRWVIDPLDGTTNYAHSIPLGCVSIALERDGQVDAAVVCDPYRRELFTAERGAGAYLNGQRLSVSAVDTLEEAVIATAVPYELDRIEPSLQLINSVARVAGAIRIIGSAVLDSAYVAAGRFDGYWESASVHPWDVAAGILLIEEAGGQVTDRTGDQLKLDAGEIVASNGHIHRDLLDHVGVAACSSD